MLDRCLADETAPPESRLRRAVPPGDFDYYILALSWSPSFCALSDQRSKRDQCYPGAGKRFVVHGLWPQRDGALIADCEAGLRPPARSDLFTVRDLFPSESLARYEWRKHGGCAGLPASAYFADVRRARANVVIPPELAESRDTVQMDPRDILRAFSAANPRLRAGMASVSCPRGVFMEVRLCMSKDLRDFTPCPDIANRTCRARQIEAPPPL